MFWCRYSSAIVLYLAEGLTLNVLLSFAQFEREVTGERIRDKIVASKKKGLWMGGVVPLGYRVQDRELIVMDDHAFLVRFIFKQYLEVKSITQLKANLDAGNIKTPVRQSNFSRGALYTMLTNPIYIGKIRHKNETYDGKHQTIIPIDLWISVQECLTGQSPTERGVSKNKQKALLKARFYDDEGNLFGHIYTKRNGRQYYYYVTRRKQGKQTRLPISEVDKAVTNGLQTALKNPDELSDILGVSVTEVVTELISATDQIDMSFIKKIARDIIEKVIFDGEKLVINLDIEKLTEAIQKQTKIKFPYQKSASTVDVPITVRRATKGALVLSKSEDPLDLPPETIKHWVRGIVWRDEHFDGKSLKQIARETKFSPSYVAKCINQSFAH